VEKGNIHTDRYRIHNTRKSQNTKENADFGDYCNSHRQLEL